MWVLIPPKDGIIKPRKRFSILTRLPFVNFFGPQGYENLQMQLGPRMLMSELQNL